MPYITEEIYSMLPIKDSASIMVSSYPKTDKKMIFKDVKLSCFVYIFTQDKCAAKSVIEKIGFGGGCINDTLIHLATSEMPFGGYKMSGIGNEGIMCSLEEVTQIKTIVLKNVLA